MRTIAILGALLGGAILAQAQTAGSSRRGPAAPLVPDQDAVITTEQMQEILSKGPTKDGKPAGLSTRLFSTDTYSCAFIRVVNTDQPHTHGAWSEVYVIQSGSGTIETGGVMKGPWTGNSAVHQGMFVDSAGKTTNGSGAANSDVHQGDPPPGVDAAGSSIENGHVRAVKAGDLVLIPAGSPHVWVKVEQPIVYLDIKFPKGNK